MLVPALNEKPRTPYLPQLPYSNAALRKDLIRVRETWRKSRRRHDRFSVYEYLAAVFDLVMVWQKENHAVDRAKKALRLMGRENEGKIEPFSAVIVCSTSRKKVDFKVRSKWVRALMFAAETKAPSERLEHFVRRLGGINECGSRLRRLNRKCR